MVALVYAKRRMVALVYAKRRRFCEKYTKAINILCGQIVEALNVKLVQK
jgi:hypothetical protein